MKKLTKMGIDALRETLPVLSKEEQRVYMGMYCGDCFWKSLSYLVTGSTSSSDSMVWNYFETNYGYDVAEERRMNGGTTFLTPQEACGYLASSGWAHNFGNHIALVDVSRISSYVYDPQIDSDYHGDNESYSQHYVVMLGFSGDTWWAYDADHDRHFSLSSAEYANYAQPVG